jgi:predicted lipoprotein with Yx(FWY)xxD motif
MKRNFIGCIVVCLTVIFTACDKDDDVVTPPKEIVLKTNATLGSYLTDKDNRTLYFFSNDANGENNCPGGCETNWPVFNVDGLDASDLGEGLSIDDFGTVTTATAKKQLTYKGWPLYYFAPGGVAEAAGQTTGEGVGGIWFVAKPDYTIMLANWQLVGSDDKKYKSDYTEGEGKTIYFTDAKGLTLYSFKNDTKNTNKFTKEDWSNNPVWPIYEQDKVVVPSVLDKSLFTSTTVFGKKQLTYKGWPLYYFGQDATTRGNNKGFTFPALKVWPVVTKDVAEAPL